MPATDAPIMLVAGEASGDLHGATLCRALRALAPARPLLGMGGERMAAEGFERLADVTAAAVTGGTEAFGPLPILLRAWRRLRVALEGSRRPAALVLIDFPEFNLRLARVARRAGIPVVYFIPPQVWAWRPWRARAVARRTSLVLAVFPFEVALYREAGARVEFIGHPVLDALAGAPTREAARRRLGLDPEASVVGLLPGSRGHEIERTVPVLHAAAARMAAARPGTRFVLAAVTGASPDPATVLGHGGPPVEIVRGDTYAVMRAADLLLVNSGTATLEAALLGTPTVVCYRMSRLSEAWVRLLVRVPWIALPNITLGRRVVPELYQRAFTAERVAAEALALLGTPAALAAQREAFRELAGVLGEPGVGHRAAQRILTLAGDEAVGREASGHVTPAPAASTVGGVGGHLGAPHAEASA
jgi:lipid-A-disaccharide synthase